MSDYKKLGQGIWNYDRVDNEKQERYIGREERKMIENEVKLCINCKNRLNENEQFVCSACDFYNDVKIEITSKVHNIDTNRLISNINILNEYNKNAEISTIITIDVHGKTETGIHNIKSIKIKDVKRIE